MITPIRAKLNQKTLGKFRFFHRQLQHKVPRILGFLYGIYSCCGRLVNWAGECLEVSLRAGNPRWHLSLGVYYLRNTGCVPPYFGGAMDRPSGPK